MRQLTVKINSLITIISLIIVFLEYMIYYFTASPLPVFLFAGVAIFLAIHIFLESSLSYESCFLFSMLTIIFSTAFTVMIYFKPIGNLLVFKDYLLFLLFIHWFIPIVYSTIRCMFDGGPRYLNFNSFFWKMSTIFAVYYAVLLIVCTFLRPVLCPLTSARPLENLIPFMVTAVNIEDSIYTGTSLGRFFLYFLKVTILSIPIGFYLRLFLKDYDKWLRIGLYLVIPIVFELFLLFTGNTLHMDDYLFRLFGIILGTFSYRILNLLFQVNTGEDFLYKRSSYSFINLYY